MSSIIAAWTEVIDFNDNSIKNGIFIILLNSNGTYFRGIELVYVLHYTSHNLFLKSYRNYDSMSFSQWQLFNLRLNSI